ncbi:MAG: GAF domain-containing protein [Bacteroidetes bacterium]|nr:MAG: GAF domain-containing protein [Bacteroidota bacterium]
MIYKNLQLSIIKIISKDHLTIPFRLTEICEILKKNIDYYDWVGFYFANQKKETLHLKAYAGEATEHTVIPFGKGICGQVAISNENFVVEDVNAQDNYISCNINVKAEIVIPLFKDGKNIGQIDIDSNTPNPFSKEDEQFLEWLNEQVAKIL